MLLEDLISKVIAKFTIQNVSIKLKKNMMIGMLVMYLQYKMFLLNNK